MFQFTPQVLAQVREVDSILRVLKDDVKSTQERLKEWETKLMFERKEGKTYSFDELQSATSAVLSARHSTIRDDGKTIIKLMSNSNRTVKISKASLAWRCYIDYVSDLLIDGFGNAIIASIRFVAQQLDPAYLAKYEVPPLLEVRLELIPPNIVAKPDLGAMA